MTYTFDGTFWRSGTVEIDADSPEEAEKRAAEGDYDREVTVDDPTDEESFEWDGDSFASPSARYPRTLPKPPLDAEDCPRCGFLGPAVPGNPDPAATTDAANQAA